MLCVKYTRNHPNWKYNVSLTQQANIRNPTIIFIISIQVTRTQREETFEFHVPKVGHLGNAQVGRGGTVSRISTTAHGPRAE